MASLEPVVAAVCFSVGLVTLATVPARGDEPVATANATDAASTDTTATLAVPRLVGELDANGGLGVLRQDGAGGLAGGVSLALRYGLWTQQFDPEEELDSGLQLILRGHTYYSPGSNNSMGVNQSAGFLRADGEAVGWLSRFGLGGIGSLGIYRDLTDSGEVTRSVLTGGPLAAVRILADSEQRFLTAQLAWLPAGAGGLSAAQGVVEAGFGTQYVYAELDHLDRPDEWLGVLGYGLRMDVTEPVSVPADVARASGLPSDCQDVQSCAAACRMGEDQACDRLAVALAQACDGHDMAACETLGSLYLKGAGVPLDPLRAAELYDKACTGGDPRACATLGGLYYDGEGVPADAGQAARLFEQSCDAGVATGCINGGYLYANGAGISMDPPRAMALYVSACKLGDQDGCRAVAELRAEQTVPGTQPTAAAPPKRPSKHHH
jgi:hypothetical protein